VAVVWIGYDQPRKLGDRETGGGLALPAWIDYMSYALRNLPVSEIAPTPGVLQFNGDWSYEEYGAMVNQLEDSPNSAAAAASEERRSIMDLFKN
jgi:penicillin-binding protein 1A